MKLPIAAVCFALSGSIVEAHYQLPHHARGGALWQSLLQHQRQSKNNTALWIELPIDHFDTANKKTFKCRYFLDDSAWIGKGPPTALFFNMGGEGPASGTGGDYVEQLALKYQARVVAIEHRFYGESVPGGVPNATSPGGLATDNMKYLTSQQALADVAALIDFVNPHQVIPTFTFGGSYSGALSAWFRIKYPSKTRGSLSSSGVVNTIFNFVEFDEVIRKAIGEQCASDWDHVTAAFDEALQKGGAEAAEAKALFGLPESYLNADFYYMIADAASMTDQYGRKKTLCDGLAGMRTAANASAVRSLFAVFVAHQFGKDFGRNCFYDTSCLRDEKHAAEWQPTSRSWRWQKCNEVAYLQPAPATKPLRSRFLTLADEVEQCKAVFGDAPQPYAGPLAGSTATLEYYGGADHIKGSQIYFSDFSDDPWQAASVQKEISPDLPYELVHCDGCGHCMDFHPANADEPAALTKSRVRFESYLEKWLHSEETVLV